MDETCNVIEKQQDVSMKNKTMKTKIQYVILWTVSFLQQEQIVF